MAKLSVAVAQRAISGDKEHNLRLLRESVQQAEDAGAQLLLLPEYAMWLDFRADQKRVYEMAEKLDGPFATAVQELSEQHSIAIIAGMHRREESEVKNSLVIARKGQKMLVYDKLHLFDAFTHRESDVVARGEHLPPLFDIAGVSVSVATCYDLRFPELFRAITDAGAQLICLCAAWTRGPLKIAHWETLIRARAIENILYVCACDDVSPVSCGTSMVCDPYGVPLAQAPDRGEALLCATIDTEPLEEARRLIPALQHRRIQTTF